MAHKTPPEAYPDHINQHGVKVDGDVLFIRFIGEYAPDEARTIMTLLCRLYEEHGHVFFLGDVSQAAVPGPETRRVIAEWRLPGDNLPSAYFGASWTIRAVTSLIHSAMRMLGRNTSPSYYAKTEAEARAWLDEQRQAQAKKE